MAARPGSRAIVRLVTLTCALASVTAGVCHPALTAQGATLAPIVDDAIASALDRCLKAPATISTLDIEACYETAGRSYDRALQRTYASVLKHLDAPSRRLVVRAQAAWTSARSAELATYRGPWTRDRGTIVGIEILQSRVRAVRERIVALDLYWPGYSAEGPLELVAPP